MVFTIDFSFSFQSQIAKELFAMHRTWRCRRFENCDPHLATNCELCWQCCFSEVHWTACWARLRESLIIALHAVILRTGNKQATRDFSFRCLHFYFPRRSRDGKKQVMAFDNYLDITIRLAVYKPEFIVSINQFCKKSGAHEKMSSRSAAWSKKNQLCWRLGGLKIVYTIESWSEVGCCDFLLMMICRLKNLVRELKKKLNVFQN